MARVGARRGHERVGTILVSYRSYDSYDLNSAELTCAAEARGALGLALFSRYFNA